MTRAEEIEDLSDDEIKARLLQRGFSPVAAAVLISRRNDPETAAIIADLLDE